VVITKGQRTQAHPWLVTARQDEPGCETFLEKFFEKNSFVQNLPESELIIETIRAVSNGLMKSGPVVAVACLM
jgi:hypothetical protein